MLLNFSIMVVVMGIVERETREPRPKALFTLQLVAVVEILAPRRSLMWNPLRGMVAVTNESF